MGKELVTYGALVRLLSRVTPQMHGQMSELSVTLLALRALVGFLSGVNPLMNCQIFSLAEALPALGALEPGLVFFGVSTQVDLEMSGLTEDLVTYGALVLFLSVSPAMENQTAGVTEASLALRALKELVAPVVVMPALVTRQIRELDESAVALGAFVRSLSFVNVAHVFAETRCLSKRL